MGVRLDSGRVPLLAQPIYHRDVNSYNGDVLISTRRGSTTVIFWVAHYQVCVPSLIASALLDDILSDLSYDSRIRIWSDALLKIIGRQNGQT